MQYHYVVGYDSEKDRWWVESDPEAYFIDGSVWSRENANDPNHGYLGWFQPEEGTFESDLDLKCWQMLHSLVPIWPSPVVNGEL